MLENEVVLFVVAQFALETSLSLVAIIFDFFRNGRKDVFS